MRVLIFALLVLGASATYSKSYSGYPSYSSYSSYPSYGGSNYGGYGSSLYGASYGSGIGYGSGGAGLSYYSGGDGGYSSGYAPAVYQTARYSYNYPHGNAASYDSGSYGYSTSGGPGKIMFTQDFSGVAGQSGYQQGAPEVTGHDALKSYVIPQHSSAYTSDTGSSGHTTDNNAGIAVDDLSRIQFAQEAAGIGAKDFVGTDETRPKFDAPSVPATGQFEKVSSGRKSGGYGSSSTGGGSQVTFTRDFSKVAARKPAIQLPEKITVPGNSQSISTQHGDGYQHKTGTQGGEITFTQDTASVSEQSDEHIDDQSDDDASGQSGHHVTGAKNAVPSLDRSATWDISGNRKHSSGQRAGYVHKSGSQGFSQGTWAGPQISFVMGGATLLQPGSGRPSAAVVPKPSYGTGTLRNTGSYTRRGETIFTQDISTISRHQGAGLRPAIASFGKVSPGRISGSQKHSSGCAHCAGFIHKSGSQGFSQESGIGPQISFVLGGANLQQQRPRPAVSVAPKPFSGATGSLSTNRAQGFSTASGPSRISFIQDFSRVSGQHQSAGIRPEISTFDNLGIPAFPGSVISKIHTGQRNKATLTSPINVRPAQIPLAVKHDLKFEKQPIVQQPTFTAIHDVSSAHGSVSGHDAGDKSLFESGPPTGFAGSYYKHDSSVDSVEDFTGDRHQSGFVIVPETTFTHAKESPVSYTSVAVDTAGIQDTSAGFGGHTGNVLSYKVTPNDESGVQPNLYVAVPAGEQDDGKSAIFLHSSDGAAPSDSFLEERGSYYQVSPGGGHSSGASTYDSHEPQLTVF